MRPYSYLIPTALAAALSLAGCASSSNGILPTTTSALPNSSALAVKKAAEKNAMCTALHDRITALRAEGTIGRIEKASTGKTKLVRVKRASLSKVAELDQANAEYQAKCSLSPAKKIKSSAKADAGKKVATAEPKKK